MDWATGPGAQAGRRAGRPGRRRAEGAPPGRPEGRRSAARGTRAEADDPAFDLARAGSGMVRLHAGRTDPSEPGTGAGGDGVLTAGSDLSQGNPLPPPAVPQNPPPAAAPP